MLKETILYAPGINDAAMLRTMALHGAQAIGLRVMHGAEFAKYILMRSGLTADGTLLTPQEVTLMLASEMRHCDYFRAASFADAETLSAALRAARLLIADGEAERMETLRDGLFPEKNAAVLKVYHGWCAACREQHKTDDIMLLRLAYANGRPLDAEILVPETVVLSPLEQAALDRLSGGRVRRIPLAALFGKAEAKPVCGGITACFGASNEVRQIFAQIAEKKLPFDSCTVAVSDPAQYAPLFREIAAEYDIPVSMRFGTPMRQTAPAKLWQQLIIWEKGHFGVDALKALLFCDAFDTDKLKALFPEGTMQESGDLAALAAVCGQLRVSADAVQNRQRIAAYRAVLEADAPETRMLDAAEILCGVLEQGYASVLREFAVCRSAADGAARSILCGGIVRCAGNPDLDVRDCVAGLLTKSVGAEMPEPGKVYITSLEYAPEALRENMFIAGLSADLFPGSRAENPVLLDDDLLRISPAAITADRILMHRKDTLRALTGLCAAMGISAELSYSDYRSAELKDANASSVLFEIWSKVHDCTDFRQFTASLRHFGYFDAPLSDADGFGSAYLAGTVTPGSAASPGLSGVYTGTRRFSPTAVEDFLICPRKFLLEHLLRAKPEEPDDVFRVIAPNTLGSLLHDCFYRLSQSGCSEADFLGLAEKMFRRHLAARPPMQREAGERALSECLDMARNGYAMIDPSAGIAAEQELTALHAASGITLHGFSDRVEDDHQGGLTILDFKTGSRIRHIDDDPRSCIQTLLYAYMLEQTTGKPVSKCRYLYLRSNKAISCAYDAAAKEYIDSVLDALRTALDTGDYPCTENAAQKEPCKYCPHLAYCGKKQREEETEDDES